MNIISFTSDNKKLTELSLMIRTDVFVKEQKVDPELEYDAFENVSIHYLVFDEEEPIATARWRETEKGIKLERFAVLATLRNKGIGGILLQRVLEDTVPLKKPIYLNSQLKAVPFYERHGFVKSGEPFMEANMGHYKMDYDPTI